MGILEEMRNILQKSGKTVTLMASLLVVLGLAVGGTVAILFDKSDAIENTFTTAEITTTVDEKFDGDVKKDVKIQNTGNAEAWIRAAVVVTWQDSEGNVYGVAPKEDTDYTIQYKTETDPTTASSWYKSTKDGFYYYTSPVAPNGENGDTTGVLITSCQPVEGSAPDGYNLCVEILGSAIQSWPLDAFNSNWKVSSGLMADGTQGSQSLSKEVSSNE